ncbi:XdhC family protein [Fortiea sp. LEGE XX443]|uniref:XdhC family protein n=1 Tax=Fortiea sp. LEGE XX443 TaxID=1828611 RepID=UPI00187FAA58|nr:XdhC/CoxI family protein [Fortiea sp. LEGE XX443]MBE9003999.1 XdhC family protein [Fortiea sp. LEGE XX443]
MKELQNILAAFKQTQNQRQLTALATVVKTSGSVYRRPGARMLLIESGQMIGCVSGGCLESDVFEIAQPLMFYSGEPVVVKYDTTASDDITWGFGLGCNGVVEVLIEPLTHPLAKSQLEFFAECLYSQQPGVMATVFNVTGESGVLVASRSLLQPDGTVVNNIADEDLAHQVLVDARQALQQEHSRVKSYKLNNGIAEVFLEVIHPLVPLIVFGAGHDAIPVVNIAKHQGWDVTVVDNRPGYITSERFPGADQIILSEPQAIHKHNLLTPRTVAVVMTHQYKNDLALLKTLLPSPVRYIGILGPKSRTQQLLQDLKSEGFIPTAAQMQRLFAPVGLDIGADSPEAIALSIVAEIQAVLANRSGGLLKKRSGSIHGEETPCLMSV